MGICASCLGLDRPSSQDGDIDRLLNSEQPTYGTRNAAGASQTACDEEELRREREVLDNITADAGDHMIDVVHPDASQVESTRPALMNQHHYHSADSYEQRKDSTTPNQSAEDAEDAAWLESIGGAYLAVVQEPRPGNLVMDIRLLRNEQHRIGKPEALN